MYYKKNETQTKEPEMALFVLPGIVHILIKH